MFPLKATGKLPFLKPTMLRCPEHDKFFQIEQWQTFIIKKMNYCLHIHAYFSFYFVFISHHIGWSPDMTRLGTGFIFCAKKDKWNNIWNAQNLKKRYKLILACSHLCLALSFLFKPEESCEKQDKVNYAVSEKDMGLRWYNVNEEDGLYWPVVDSFGSSCN